MKNNLDEITRRKLLLENVRGELTVDLMDQL